MPQTLFIPLRTPPVRVLLPILLAAALAGTAACTRHEPEVAGPAPLPAGSNILLITVDTLRADHLSSYGYVRPTSPVVDKLAAEGVRFDQAQVQWPKTTPSFASIFTASYPKDNQIVRTAGQPVSCKFSMLAEELKRRGYATAAVVANAAVGSDFYFDQGFDEFIETWKLHESQKGADPNRAEAVTNLAIGQLDRLKASGKPYFLWVHYLDPHAPYEPPPPYRDRFQNDAHFDASVRIPLSDKPKQQMFGIGKERMLDGRDELAFYVARYDAEIAYTDGQIGRLLAEMKTRGLLQKTLTAFTADHGESLGDHGYYFDHGRFSFQTCLHVPLILHYPGVLAPRVDKEPVELIHLAPTLLEAAGAKLTGGTWMQGHTLTARLRGEKEPPPRGAEEAKAGTAPAPSPGVAFSEAGWETNNKWQKVARDGRFKLIFAQTRPEQRFIGGEGVRFVLFDLENDPGETKNVFDQFRQDGERLERELWKWDRAPRVDVEVDAQGGTCGGERAVSKETEDLLRSLGYL